MGFKKCNYCSNKVPEGGQCNKCGFVDGFVRMPTPAEFKHARAINKQHDYEQYQNIDMLLIDE
ncbi:hypothetical protein HZB01_04530 [Candidatus Woesearchaeota archaeon]|nr:hypothetical protein [Candidatus Woesearchaeota archaeon]